MQDAGYKVMKEYTGVDPGPILYLVSLIFLTL